MFIVCQMDKEMYTTGHNRIMQVVYCLKNSMYIILSALLMGFPFYRNQEVQFFITCSKYQLSTLQMTAHVGTYFNGIKGVKQEFAR